MKLRAKVFRLSLSTVIPPLVLAIVLGVLLVQYEQDAVRRGALDRNRAFMTAVDAEIGGHITTLNALAASHHLESENLAGFYDEAQRALRLHGNWQSIILLAPSGQEVVNTSLPLGAGLPRALERASLDKVVTTAAPAVGDVTFQPNLGKYGIPVRVPVWRDGSVAFVLCAFIAPETFGRMIEAQHLPSTWISGLVDRSGHFIARVPPRAPGEMASANYLEALARSREGWYRGTTVEGTDAYTAYRTSALSDWSIGLAIPSGEVNAAANRAAWLVSLGALLTLGLAVALALVLGRDVTEPIAALATAARSIGRSSDPVTSAPDTDIEELRDVARALADASAAIHERQSLIEREQSALRAADRAKDEFLAMLGHELRNPLSAVSNAATLLNRADLSPERRAIAHAIITRQTEQLTRLVNDLLDVGRVVAGKIHLEAQPVELCEVANAALAAIRATGRADAHRISIDAPEPVHVLGDRPRLEQVVTNLILNAISYTPADGAIDIRVAKDAAFALLSVTDTGIGLRDEDRDAVFALFYQADKTLHRKGGLGIGLTLVKRLVEMHGGTVSATSAGLGKGATFSVRLPLTHALPAAPGASPAREAVSALAILVVDDSEDVRNSMRLRLEAEGHRVYLAADGLSGLDTVLAMKPDVALIDIGMPGMDGYQLARAIRQGGNADILLIALTGYGQSTDVHRAMDAGFDAHMVKPADFAALEALIARGLRQRQPAPKVPLVRS